jgi:hypothetical protein
MIGRGGYEMPVVVVQYAKIKLFRGLKHTIDLLGLFCVFCIESDFDEVFIDICLSQRGYQFRMLCIQPASW